jgi:hypothetical protein
VIRRSGRPINATAVIRSELHITTRVIIVLQLAAESVSNHNCDGR